MTNISINTCDEIVLCLHANIKEVVEEMADKDVRNSRLQASFHDIEYYLAAGGDTVPF